MFTALLPVFCLILLGAVLYRLDFPGDDFWAAAEKLTYFLLFPVLLFTKLATARVSDIDALGTGIVIVLLLSAATILLLLAGRLIKMLPPAFTSFYQGGIRFNTYVGLAAIHELQGSAGIALAAVALGIMIPLVNVFTIGVFAIKLPSADGRLTSILKNVLKNPLILACALGVAWSQLGIAVPLVISSVLDLLSSMALPLGLLAVGAGLRLTALKKVSGGFFLSSLIKLVVLPVLAYWLSRLMGLDDAMTGVLVAIACLPTASSAYILARQLNGDAPLMAAIISGQTLLAIMTMPLMLAWLS